MPNNLNGKRVLVVEDNYLLAMDLVDELEAANAVVVGPCVNLAEASLQVVHSDLAILDVNLGGENTFHLADRLKALDVPYIFFTGYDKHVLPERFADDECISKPELPSTVVRQLDQRSRITSGNIVDLVPMLRARARSFVGDASAADRLVELTLQCAIDDRRPMPSGADVAPWLIRLMDEIMAAGPRGFMN